MLRERKLEVDFERRLAEEAAERPRRRWATTLSVLLAACIIAVGGLYGARVLADRIAGPGQPQILSDLVAQVELVRKAVPPLYSSSSGYDELDDIALIRSGGLPRNMAPRGAIMTVLGTPIHVGTADKGYTVTLAGIPDWACAKLAANDEVAANAISVVVMSPSSAGNPHPAPLEPEEAQDECGSTGGVAAVQWNFR